MHFKIALTSLLLFSATFAHAHLFCTTTMVGGARLDGGGFWRSDVRFSSRSMCEAAVRSSRNGLICLNHNNFFYSLYNVAWGEQLDSQYMGLNECLSALKKARKGLVCASAVRRGTHKLIRIDDHASRDFESYEACQSFLDSLE